MICILVVTKKRLNLSMFPTVFIEHETLLWQGILGTNKCLEKNDLDNPDT